MTDYDKLKALLTEFGVGFTEETTHDNLPLLTCDEGNAKIGGYVRFYTEFAFDAEGNFVEMGATK